MLKRTQLEHEGDALLKELKAELSDSDNVCIFYMPKCSFYEYIMPFLDRLIEEFPNITFHKIDITYSDVPAKRMFNFFTIPTVVHMKGGRERFRHGTNDRTITYQQIKNHLKKTYEY